MPKKPSPQEESPNYFVIIRKHWTGKLTLMKAACLKVDGGFIYVDMPEDVHDFGNSFVTTI
ncbi:hypothetical protein HK100_009578, partial [Physocladia obscura]